MRKSAAGRRRKSAVGQMRMSVAGRRRTSAAGQRRISASGRRWCVCGVLRHVCRLVCFLTELCAHIAYLFVNF